MARKGIEMCLGVVVIVVILMWHGAEAQTSQCSSALISLSPCLNFVTGNTSTPTQSCCSQLASVVSSTPQCLCALMSGAGVSMGISINQTLALQLPGACNVQTPPISKCNAVANGPASSPAASPATSPSSPSDDTDETPSSTTTATPTVPASGTGTGTGSKTTPSTNGNTSAGNLEKPFNLSTAIIFLAALASIVINF